MQQATLRLKTVSACGQCAAMPCRAWQRHGRTVGTSAPSQRPGTRLAVAPLCTVGIDAARDRNLRRSLCMQRATGYMHAGVGRWNRLTGS